MRPTLLLAALALALLAPAAPAAAEPWTVDHDHAYVSFRASHLGFSDVLGRFRDFEAEIDFDPEDVEAASVTFRIAADSVETFHDRRDEHLRSEDFLDAANHPEIVFVSREVRLTSADTAEMVGDLTIRGVTHEETFEVRLNRIGASPFDRERIIAGFLVTGEIDRRRYGSTFGAPAIGAVVPVRVEFEASPASGGGG
jgi:polyisoprenoid-binding protein YceI